MANDSWVSLGYDFFCLMAGKHSIATRRKVHCIVHSLLERFQNLSSASSSPKNIPAPACLGCIDMGSSQGVVVAFIEDKASGDGTLSSVSCVVISGS